MHEMAEYILYIIKTTKCFKQVMNITKKNIKNSQITMSFFKEVIGKYLLKGKLLKRDRTLSFHALRLAIGKTPLSGHDVPRDYTRCHVYLKKNVVTKKYSK